MMLNKLIVVVLVTLIGTSNATSPAAAVAVVRTAISVINEVYTLATGVKDVVNVIKPDKSNAIFQEKVTKKLNDIHTVCTRIDDVKGAIGNLSTIISEDNKNLETSIRFINAQRIVGDFKKNIDYVNKIYFDEFTAVWNKMKNYRRGTVDNHIQGIVSDSTFHRALSEMISDITSSPTSQSSIFSAMSQYYESQNGYKFHCENISPLDDLHIFYSNVITTFARGYAVLLTSYEYLKMKSNDYEFYQDRQSTEFKNFKEAIEAITQHAKIDFDLITNSDYRASYACNTNPWKEGRNFIRVKNYISVQIARSYADFVDTEPKVDSNEYDCESGIAVYRGSLGADFDTTTYLCTTPFSPDLANPYSVEYTELTNFWGRDWESRRCRPGVSADRYTLCSNDWQSDPLLSVRKLSLRLQECDTSKNEVVTDARFHKQDNKIHIKLQCGVLKDGDIYVNTLRWTQDNEPFLENNSREYVVLSSKLKSFNLDNVVVPNGELVTGLGFKVVDQHFISLEVKANKVNNYNHGNTFGESTLYSAPKSNKPRKHVDITGLERPPKTMEETYDMGKAGETYISLTLSKFSREYNNQAVVPYFDMTPYKANNEEPPVTPLGGVGLFYKSLPNFTGFLAFKHLSPTYIQFVDIPETTQSALGNAQRPFN